MAHQKAWTKHEVALLVETYIKISQEGCNLEEQLERLSELLRKMAIAEGIEIDDVYRNLNGMHWQYGLMKAAFEKEEFNSRGPSQLFIQMANLYKTDKAEFDKILKEAYQKVYSTEAPMTEITDNRQKFEEWLKEHPTKKITPAACVECLCRVSEYAVSRNFSKCDFWVITDYKVFNRVRVMVTNNKIYRFKHPNLYRAFEFAGKLYSDFLKETYPPVDVPVVETAQAPKHDSRPITEPEAVINKVEPEAQPSVEVADEREIIHRFFQSDVSEKLFLDLYNYQKQTVPECVVENRDSIIGVRKIDERLRFYVDQQGQIHFPRIWVNDARYITPFVPEAVNEFYSAIDKTDKLYLKDSLKKEKELNGEVVTVDFTKSESYTYTKVVKVSYFGEEAAPRNWRGAYLFILTKMYGDYPTQFETISRDCTSAGTKINFSHDQGDLRAPIQFATDFYAEGNMSAVAIVNSIGALLRFCMVDYENVVIEYAADVATVSRDEVPEISADSEGMPEYFAWLRDVKKLAPTSVRHYVSDLKKADSYLLERRIISQSIFTLDDDSLQSAVEKALANEEFADFNKREHNRFSAALKAYLMYKLGAAGGDIQRRQRVSKPLESSENLREFSTWLIESRGLSQNTARGYVSSLGTVNTYALDNGLIETSLFDIPDADLQQAVQGVFDDSAFAEYNSGQHNRFSAALQMYLQFKLGAAVEVAFKRRRRSSAVARPAVECPSELRELLVRKFPYGIRIDSSIDLMKLKNFAEMFEVEIPADENLLKSYIVAGGINFEGKTYFISDEVCEEIVAKVRAIFDEGFTLIYYEEFFNKFFEWFDEKHISSAELVRELLASLMPDCFFSKNFVYADADRINELEAVENELANVWGEQTLHTYDELYEVLPYIPDEKIRFYLSNSKLFVWSSNETFVWIEKVVISDEDKQAILDYANNACNSTGYAAMSDLPLDKIIEENYELSLTAIYKAVYVIVLENDFALNGKILNKNNSSIDELSLAKAYCAERDECSFTELYSYIEDLVGSGSRRKTFIAAYDVMIRVGEDKFVADKYVNFDVDAIDSLLKEAIVGDFIAVKGIATFALFPNCNYTWNHYILESFCYKYSKLYRLEVINFNDKNAGIIVKKKSNLGYADMLALVAAKSGIDLNIDTVGQYLFDNGYVAKRKMSIMEEVVEKAKSLREVR